MISSTQSSVPDNTHPQETDIRAPGGIRPRNPSKRAAADTRRRRRGHWRRKKYEIGEQNKDFSLNLDDWLTVHRSITLVDLQLDAKNSYLFIYNTFIYI